MKLTLFQRTLFLLNATVLITHQIDAAFWHEWELFHIPGGNQVNLLVIHTGFFLSGSEAFIQPMSIALLVAAAVLSTLQLLALRNQST